VGEWPGRSADPVRNLLLAPFPELASQLNNSDGEGLLHSQVAEFADFAQKAIDAGDRTTVERSFRLADLAASQGDDAVQNAIGVSFVEHLTCGMEG
jgi:hypothetical protein